MQGKDGEPSEWAEGRRGLLSDLQGRMRAHRGPTRDQGGCVALSKTGCARVGRERDEAGVLCAKKWKMGSQGKTYARE